eukprot:11168971-Lingulodinium_polyedra.AAC.1
MPISLPFNGHSLDVQIRSRGDTTFPKLPDLMMDDCTPREEPIEQSIATNARQTQDLVAA